MNTRTTSADIVIVGAGVAGMATALGLAGLRVHVVTKGVFGATGASPLAQGGLAAAIGPDDSPLSHAADTLAVSGGTGDPALASLVTDAAPGIVDRLAQLGAAFDRDVTGRLALGREAGHSRARIVHARDATGAEIVRVLSDAVRMAQDVTVFESHRAVDIALVRGRVAGLWCVDPDGRLTLHVAPAVVVAAGGVGQLFSHTTNPVEATGDGLAMAARAGARLADLEMVQFHPTALDVGIDPMPLITEALRGAGAAVIDDGGRRFLFDVDPRGELAPRDVVALALFHHRASGGRAWLDATALGDDLLIRFPTVFDACRRQSIDPRVDLIPIAPAAHYHMGGIATDAKGRTSLPGLWACGEAACTGLHGANRLASNSLLEGLVIAAHVAADVRLAPRLAAVASLEAPTMADAAPEDASVIAALRDTMWQTCGLQRHARGLHDTQAQLAKLEERLAPGHSTARNMIEVAQLIASAALARNESRGSHFRTDYPHLDPTWARRHFVDAAPRDVRVRRVAGASR